MDNYVNLPIEGGGGAGVTSLNTLTGALTLVAGTGISITPGVSTLTISATVIPPVGDPNTFAGFNGTGDLFTIPGFNIDTTSGGMYLNLTEQPNGLTGAFDVNRRDISIDPIANSPNETWNVVNNQVQLDPNSSGFQIGTNGQSLRFHTNNANLNGTSNIGTIEFIQNNFNLGNGTDPVDVGGFAYMNGFGQINANATLVGPAQGYGFQFNVNSAASISPSTYIQGFYDNVNIGCASPGYTSFNAGPNIASINNNNNYIGLAVSPTIGDFTGNAGFQGVSVGGNLGDFHANGYFHGVNVNPTITEARFAAGVNVSMDSVVPYAGVQSTLTEQDLTFTFNQPGDNNSYSLEYTPGATAGSEVVSILGNAITVQIDNGVSTALQIKAALEAIPAVLTALTITISGVGSNPQVVFGPTNFANGENPGQVLAGFFDGDVQITGSLSFSGALSIGQLSSFATVDMATLGPGVQSIDTLITAPTLAASTSISGTDLLAINTAMLLTTGDNSSITTSFLGVAALGLPAVVSMGTGATIDRVSGAVFAISLDAGAAGGTIDEVDLCRALAIPNGATTITKLKAYQFDLPFGDPGTTTWGVYMEPVCHNFMAGDLKIGGTDVVANSSVGLEIESTTKTFLNARMTTVERDALTAIDGMQVYNTDDNELQVYANGAWTSTVLPTQQIFTSGSGTYTTPTGVRYIRIRAVGGGGSGGTPAANGNDGTDTTFDSLTAGKGLGGAGAGSSAGPSGGTATGGDINVSGGAGGTGGSSVLYIGGAGGGSYFGGGGAGGKALIAGAAAAAYGSGGGGAGSTTNDGRQGGSAGAYLEKLILAPAASYSYSVGSGGASNSGNGSTYSASGAGAGGIIIVDEFY